MGLFDKLLNRPEKLQAGISYDEIEDNYKNGLINQEQLKQQMADKLAYDNRQADIQGMKDIVSSGLRAGIGGSLIGTSFHPILNIPYVGTGLGGALFEMGNSINNRESAKDTLKNMGKGFALGETVGAIPYVGKGINKASGGRIGEGVSNLYEKLMDTPVGQKVGEYGSKLVDLLMTDIKAFNPNKQTVYHGSPYDFEKFSNEAIGTGEGAQAHGMGHYVAKNRDVANKYKEVLAHENLELYPEITKQLSSNAINKLKVMPKDNAIYSLTYEIKDAENYLKEAKFYNELTPEMEKAEIENISNLKKDLDDIKNIDTNNIGQLYKLSIPKDDVMLREGATLAEQPKKVQEAIYKLGGNKFSDANTGREIYNKLGQNASEQLNNAGIKGISYNGGIDGEANVIFNPDDIDIVRKYYNQPNLYDYLMSISPNKGAGLELIENVLENPVYPMGEGFKNYEKLGLDYYKNNMQPNPTEIKGYGTIHYSRHNRGKDSATNFDMYPKLDEHLKKAVKGERTNRKDEKDREYDHFYRRKNGNLYEFLIEDINGIGKKYKKMYKWTKD